MSGPDLIIVAQEDVERSRLEVAIAALRELAGTPDEATAETVDGVRVGDLWLVLDAAEASLAQQEQP